MPETLTRIQAPQLGSSYGANISTTFDNINANFGVVANHDFVKGDKGSSVIIFKTSWNSLLNQNGSTYTYDGKQFTLEDQTDAIKDALSIGTSADKTRFTNELRLSTASNIIICFDEESGELTYVFPVVAMDTIFTNDDSDDFNYPSDLYGLLDLSCVLYYQGSGWASAQPFPTLYYDGSYLKWRINGQNTEVNAQGPEGLPGKDSVNWIGKCTYSTSNNMQTITHFLIGTSWVASGSLGSGVNPATGDMIYVISNNRPGEYWISSLYVESGGVYKACCVESDSRTAGIDEQGFQTVMAAINPAGTNKGLFVPDKLQFSDTTTEGFIIKNTANNELTIAKTTDTGSTTTSGGTLKSKMELIVDGIIQATQVNTPTISATDLNLNALRVSEGPESMASGSYSHAEGWGSAEGSYSHAEGLGMASGSYSHAEGGYGDPQDYNEPTYAPGEGSHAEGRNTTASGIASHAEGLGTVTNFEGEHACGKYNLSGYLYSSGNKYAICKKQTDLTITAGGTTWVKFMDDNHTIFSVGFGTGDTDSQRSNLLMCCADGNTYVTLNSTGYISNGAAAGSFQIFARVSTIS